MGGVRSSNTLKRAQSVSASQEQLSQETVGGLWSTIVASWKTGEDALAWAKGMSISPEQLGNSGWLRVKSGYLSPDGITKSLSGLYKAIS
jgi:hypothetical protein